MKSNCLFNCTSHFVVQFLVTFIWRKIEAIEAEERGGVIIMTDLSISRHLRVPMSSVRGSLIDLSSLLYRERKSGSLNSL